MLQFLRKFHGRDTVDNTILRFHYALSIRILYEIDGHVSAVHTGVSTEISVYR
jgi:hypothetical protein